MKFLLFNITVLTALAYLLFDNGQMQNISNIVQKSSLNVMEQVKTPGKLLHEKLNENKHSRNDNEAVGRSQDAIKRQPPYASPSVTNDNQTIKKLDEGLNASKKIIPLPEPEHVALRKELSPQKPKREDDKIKNKSQRHDIPIVKKKDEQEFMSRSDRRKELQKIARSAEDLFIDRMIK